MPLFCTRTIIGLSLLCAFYSFTDFAPLQTARFASGFQAQASSQANISEAEVNRLLEHMKAAVEKRNAKALSAYFTPDAQIFIHLPMFMGGKQTFNRTTYEKMLTEGWQVLENSDYTYAVKNINIQIDPEKDQAQVTDETHESFLLAGKKVLSVAKETMLVVRHEGQLKVKILKGKVKLNL